ncbi:MAG: D-galactarate dehydratase [Boseongicola sp.]|nr:D-galactarate dehydratase [Boseongicola sp.]
MRWSVGLVLGVVLAGCVVPPEVDVSVPEPEVIDAIEAPAPPPDARRVDEFDTTTEEQRAAALETSNDGVLLGEEVLSLGDPGRSGFWVETPLVATVGEGRIALKDGSREVEVVLFPGTGSGRISLAAMRLLEVPLTSLVEVNIYENQ